MKIGDKVKLNPTVFGSYNSHLNLGTIEVVAEPINPTVSTRYLVKFENDLKVWYEAHQLLMWYETPMSGFVGSLSKFGDVLKVLNLDVGHEFFFNDVETGNQYVFKRTK